MKTPIETLRSLVHGLPTLAMATLALACAGTDPDAIRVVRVDAQAILAVPADEAYVVDLSRPRIVYEIDATQEPLDLARVLVQASGGERVDLRTWLAGQPLDLLPGERGFLRLGGEEAIGAYLAGQTSAGGASERTEALQACWGDDACNRMFSGDCGTGGAICYESDRGGVLCFCW